MTAEIGRVLGGRYRLVAPLGMGASAQVYLADDVRLRRRVALKMLHDALAGDAEFLRRFRAEARAAAALSHPNVMAVYDWGDDDTAFIVTEFLGGGSLRALLDQGETLSPSQALTVGLEATRALDYAHRRGFVHRDIKPANLLFGEEQRLRIADFGLARALAEAAWTEPQGAVVGTARYASPEQAKGEKLSGKADVYALALVIIEAVTGEVPFVADTTLGTLMARVDKDLVVPDALGPLQGVLARAGHPDPEQRIDARTLAAGLLRAAKALPRPALLPLAGALPRAGQVELGDDPTVHAPVAEPEVHLRDDDLDLDPPAWVNRSEPSAAGGAAAGGAAAVAAAAGGALIGGGPAGDDRADGGPADDDDDGPVDDHDAAASGDETGTDGEPGGAVPADGGVADGEGVPDGDGDVAPAAVDEDPTRLDRSPDDPDPGDAGGDPTTVLAVPAATYGDPTTTTEVPAPAGPGPGGHPVDDVDGDDADDGRRRRRWPWVALVVLVLLGVGGVAAATAIDREPPPPARIVVLPVPDLVGLTQPEAEEVLRAAGWTVEVDLTRRNDTTAGDVLEVDPGPGSRLGPGEPVTITVSEGQEMVAVPDDLAGQGFDEARAVLFELGLGSAAEENRFDEEVPAGVAIGVVDGTPSELERGSTVGLVVSDGPAPRTVPAGLQGSTQAAATEAIEGVQLAVEVDPQFNDDVAEGVVVSVRPGSGSEVPRGATVTIEVSRGPEPVTVPDVSGTDSPAAAAALLRQAGLVPGQVSGPSEGSPSGTSPSAGTDVAPGTTVDISLG